MFLPSARASTNEVIYNLRSRNVVTASCEPLPIELFLPSIRWSHCVNDIYPVGSRELVGSTRYYQFMDVSHRQLRRIVDSQLREMHRYFVGQAVPPQIGQLLDGVSSKASFESSRQNQRTFELE